MSLAPAVLIPSALGYAALVGVEPMVDMALAEFHRRTGSSISFETAA